MGNASSEVDQVMLLGTLVILPCSFLKLRAPNLVSRSTRGSEKPWCLESPCSGPFNQSLGSLYLCDLWNPYLPVRVYAAV